MQLLLLATLGGALGAGARHLVNVACAHWLSPSFPWATFIVNVVGSFLMGAVIASLAPYFGGSPAVRTFLATGILGGFTTFSAFSLDAIELMERGQLTGLAFYVLGSVVLSILALLAGVGVIRVSLR
ncbi:MAG: fluoride efflux transporter CrcB [Hyphomicrobiaceae bacterium]